MPARRLLAIVALLAIISVCGCTRTLRRDRPRPIPVEQPRDLSGPAPMAAPVPPTPPPLPTTVVTPPVAPPKPDALGGIVPPIPLEIPDSPIVPASGTEPILTESDDKKPLRDRIEELRKKREEKKQPVPEMPSPFAPKNSPEAAPAPKRAGTPVGNDMTEIRKLLEAATKRWAEVTDFEARLRKREVVNDKQMPSDELVYRFRKQPLSVYMKTLSEAGQGREVMFVKGQFDNKLHVLTGKGDNILVGAGYKTELDPDSRMATSRSRSRVYQAGLDKAFVGLNQAIEGIESGKPVGLKWLGPTKRAEYPYPLDGIEMTLKPGLDPLMPKGGKRLFYFDAKADSPSYLLPVLVTATEPDGREVEYYCFDRFKVPSGWTDADWNPSKLGKK